MRPLAIAGLVLLCAVPVRAQAPPIDWHEAYEHPYEADRYPGWHADEDTVVTSDDFENCDGDDDCYRMLLRRMLNEVIHQRAEIERLDREVQVLNEVPRLTLVPAEPHITLYENGKAISQPLYMVFPNAAPLTFDWRPPNEPQGGVQIGTKVP